MAFNSTPGAADANSYISVVETDEYFSHHLYSTDWDNATSGQKENSLVMSTRILDEKVDWIGLKNTKEQALAWGRSGVIDDGYDVDATIIPQPIKNATAEFARHLLIDDLTENADGKGLRKLEVGSVKLSFDKSDTADVLPDIVQEMLKGWGHIWVRNTFSVGSLKRN